MEVLSKFSARRKIRLFVKKKILQAILSRSSELFVRGNDKISQMPLLGETYEPDLSALITHGVEIGFNDFLIDIGANIGLVTCQESSKFKAIYCYEPNKIIFSVLEANIALSNLLEKVQIFNFGLGEQEGQFLLKMPRNNLGAGFVQSADNSYTKEVLARKDNETDLEFRNYLQQEIEIRSAKTYLRKNFQDLREKGFSRGIIKIDVEGMEASIIRNLIEVIPSDFSALVAFENHDPFLKRQALTYEALSERTHDFRLYSLIVKFPFPIRAPRIYKGIRSILGSVIIASREINEAIVPVGTLFLELMPKKSD